jgi:hypothetical protein
MSRGNGKYKIGIRIYFENSQTGKVISASTQKDGWFMTNKLAAGNYIIRKFYLEKEEGHTIYQMTLEGPFFITLAEGMVNNMGAIQIDIGNEHYSLRVVDEESVRFDFQNDFPDSEWNGYEWKNIPRFDAKPSDKVGFNQQTREGRDMPLPEIHTGGAYA